MWENIRTFLLEPHLIDEINCFLHFPLDDLYHYGGKLRVDYLELFPGRVFPDDYIRLHHHEISGGVHHDLMDFAIYSKHKTRRFPDEFDVSHGAFSLGVSVRGDLETPDKHTAGRAYSPIPPDGARKLFLFQSDQ
jgi:hypothetical protein